MSEGGELKRVGGKLVYRGPIASVRMDRFQYPDGSKDIRQVVVHPGAVCMVAHDNQVLYMVRQPREPVEEPALLELPAGKLDVAGETPLECAQRELAEEIGKSAGDWRQLKSFYASPGFATERMDLDMTIIHGRGELKAKVTGPAASPSIRVNPSALLRDLDRGKVDKGLGDLLKKIR